MAVLFFTIGYAVPRLGPVVDAVVFAAAVLAVIGLLISTESWRRNF